MSLMVQAHAGGQLDFREAKPFDRRWWLKVRWVLDEVERHNLNSLDGMRHALHCGLITYLAGQDSLDLHWDQALDVENQVRGRLFPWLGNPEDFKEAGRKRLAEAWKTVFDCDPDTPEGAEKIRETTDFLKKLRRGEVGSGSK